MNRVNTFVDYRTELVEESSKKVEAEIAHESSLKRAGEKLEQESSKKQKLEEDKESEELKQCLEIVPDDGDDVTIDATPLSTKSPTISIVKAIFKKTEPVNYMDNFLLLNLKTMFEHHVEDNVWKNQQRLVKVLNWKLYDACGVHCLQVDYECEMAFELLRLVKKQLKEGYGRIVEITSLLEVTAAKVCVTTAKQYTASVKLVLLLKIEENILMQVEELKSVNVSLNLSVEELYKARAHAEATLRERDELISDQCEKMRLSKEQSELFYKCLLRCKKEYNDLLASNDVLKQSLETKFKFLKHDISLEKMIEMTKKENESNISKISITNSTLEIKNLELVKEMGDKMKCFDEEKKVFENKISKLEKVLTQRVKDFDDVKTKLSRRTDKFEKYFANLEKENAY
ncbi:hypothetical protein Tco_0591049 [Tanacetum coccineum]